MRCGRIDEPVIRRAVDVLVASTTGARYRGPVVASVFVNDTDPIVSGALPELRSVQTDDGSFARPIAAMNAACGIQCTGGRTLVGYVKRRVRSDVAQVTREAAGLDPRRADHDLVVPLRINAHDRCIGRDRRLSRTEREKSMWCSRAACIRCLPSGS